jgi:hypothetical protein
LRSLALAGLTLIWGTGCVNGLIYTHVTRPLDLNFHQTEVHQEQSRDSWNTFQYYLRVDWGSAGLGDIAKKNGFTKIHYADLETLSILGIWTQSYAHVYGER